MKKQLTCGSLFAGIGGFDLGFERAGIKTIWQVEIDEYCRRVLAKHFPDAERFGDIRECGGCGQFRKDTPNRLRAVDVIAGGFPCQDISSAGKRVGITGERSGLWKEYLRIIHEVRPRYVVIENVAALLGNGMDVVLRDLSESRYDAEWQVISAADVGAHHLRERVWIIAYPESNLRRASGDDGSKPPDGRSPILAHAASGVRLGRASGNQGHAALCGEDVADANRQGLQKREVLAGIRPGEKGAFAREITANNSDVVHTASEGFPDWAGGAVGQPRALTEFERPGGREIERDFRGMAHGVSRRVDRLRSLGNAVVPQIAEWIGRRIVEAEEVATTV